MSKIAPILSIIAAGLMNGSFVIPAKYITHSIREKIWLYHSAIGLILIPWLILAVVLPEAFQHYFHLSIPILLSIFLGGIIFGLGQVCFANAIESIGVALSFTVNLGIGLIIGSMFVVFYKAAFFTEKGLLVTLAVTFVIFSLIFYYHAGKTKKIHKNIDHSHKFIYARGWILALLAGITSGLQNVTFFLLAFQAKTHFQTTDSFWVWPPFLLCAAIPMLAGFQYKISQIKSDFPSQGFFNFRNLTLITLMGLLFTGSLALYSAGMSHLNHQQQIIGWPAFIVSIIMASQMWGWVYKEAKSNTLKNKFYRFCSFMLLLMAVTILANQL